jgi:CRISPR/Cas system-associated endonuclease/helicase Cas3
LINKLKLPKAQVKYEMSAPNPIEFKEFTKYHIIECNGYFKLQYTEKGKQIEKIARCKRQSKEQALNSLKEKAPDKHMFDIAMKKYTQKTSEEQLVSVPSKKIIGKNSNQIPFVIPYPMPTPTETRIINRFRAIKEKEKQSKPKPDVAIPKIRQLPRKVIETDYSWMYQLDNVILCQ